MQRRALKGGFLSHGVQDWIQQRLEPTALTRTKMEGDDVGLTHISAPNYRRGWFAQPKRINGPCPSGAPNHSNRWPRKRVTTRSIIDPMALRPCADISGST